MALSVLKLLVGLRSPEISVDTSQILKLTLLAALSELEGASVDLDMFFGRGARGALGILGVLGALAGRGARGGRGSRGNRGGLGSRAARGVREGRRVLSDRGGPGRADIIGRSTSREGR